MKPSWLPSLASMAVTVSDTGMRLPSFRTYVHSLVSARLRRAAATKTSKPGDTPSSLARAATSGGSWISAGVSWPTTSSAS